MQKETNYASIWSFVAMILIAIMGLSMLFTPASVEPKMPTADEIATSVLSQIVIPTVPTAEEIVAQIDIDMPDTILSVRDEKKVLAEELALEEMDTRDFKTELADFLEGYSEVEDINRHDIEKYDVKDVDVTIRGENAIVEVEFKVDFENFGDESETARVIAYFTVTDLDRDDDYEDAEIDDFGEFELVKFYGDLK